MRKILKNRLALSTVITTLIILVVSVLLAGVVTYFAINVVSTRVQQESVQIDFAHIWCDSSGNAVGALVITNTGGRDIVINQIQVRGQPVWPYGTGAVVATAGTQGTDVASQTITALKAYTAAEGKTDGPIVLASGSTEDVFIAAPGSVSAADIGTSVGFTVFTAQASYYHETNVEASTSSLA
jgi:hypothetical protein